VGILQNIYHSIFTYDVFFLRALSEEQLICECGIHNSIHRLRIMEAIHEIEREWNKEYEDNPDKNLDVFISYRRSNGSQLAR
jgi:SAM domain (Sterile alpha motif).